MNGYAKVEMEYERARESAGEPCEPTVIRAEKEYEPDGYSMNDDIKEFPVYKLLYGAKF